MAFSRSPARRTAWPKASRCSRSIRWGLGIPFLITSLAINQFFGAAKRIRRYYHAIEVASGALLIVIGLLIITGQMTIITRYLQPYLPTF